VTSDGPNRIKKLARHLRRQRNIERRLVQLERDFEAADSMEAELRINDEIRRQRLYLLRTDNRLERVTSRTQRSQIRDELQRGAGRQQVRVRGRYGWRYGE
jgi:hypothetical protein